MRKYVPKVKGQQMHLCLLLAAVFLNLMVNPFPAVMAAYTNGPGILPVSVPEGYDEDTWERLNDNLLEYEELADRIKEFNSNMISADGAFQAAMEDVSDEARSAYKEAEDYRNDADDLRDSGGTSTVEGQIMYATLRAYQKAMQSTGDQISRAVEVNSRPNSSSYGSVRKAWKQLTSAAQQVMLGYSTAVSQKNTLLAMEEMYDRIYDSTVKKQKLGMATDAELLAAKKNALAAKSSLSSLDNTIDSLRSTLCLMTGWNEGDFPEICPVPPLDMERIEKINLETDTDAAIRNNYTIISTRHEDSDQTSAGFKSKARSVSQSEQMVAIELENIYGDIKKNMKEYEASVTAYEQALITQKAANVQLQNGMISCSDYLGLQISVFQAEGEKNSSELALRRSVEEYYWATEGLLDF
ncbi:hypothetical protein AALB39_14795 [Lachnospiraceae bacterium 54-53]